jgi:hypothetical protein
MVLLAQLMVGKKKRSVVGFVVDREKTKVIGE